MSKQRRERQSWAIRFRVLERDGFRCRYCGTPAKETKLVVDHVIPLALGGEDHPRNMAAACVPCNGGKGARMLEAVS